MIIYLCFLVQCIQATNTNTFDSIDISWSLVSSISNLNYFRGACDVYNNIGYLLNTGWCVPGPNCFYSNDIHTLYFITSEFSTLNTTIPDPYSMILENPTSKLLIDNYLYILPWSCWNCTFNATIRPFYRLNMNTLVFETLKSKPDGSEDSALCYDKYNNTIYSVGGKGSAKVLTYDINTNEWHSNIPNLNQYREDAFCMEHNYKIFVMLGNGWWTYNDEKRIEILDLGNIGNGWIYDNTEIPLFLSQPYVVKLNPFPWILFMGGRDFYSLRDDKLNNKILIYDYENNKIKIITNNSFLLPYIPAFGCLIYDDMNQTIYYIGGEDANNGFEKINEIWKSNIFNEIIDITTTTSSIAQSYVVNVSNTTVSLMSTFDNKGDDDKGDINRIILIVLIIAASICILILIIYSLHLKLTANKMKEQSDIISNNKCKNEINSVPSSPETEQVSTPGNLIDENVKDFDVDDIYLQNEITVHDIK